MGYGNMVGCCLKTNNRGILYTDLELENVTMTPRRVSGSPFRIRTLLNRSLTLVFRLFSLALAWTGPESVDK